MEENENKVIENNEEQVKEVNTASQEVQEKKTNTCGLISFIFSMVGIVIFGLICGIVALITGIIGVSTFDAAKQKNKWMAITGLCVGAVEIVIMGLYMLA